MADPVIVPILLLERLRPRRLLSKNIQLVELGFEPKEAGFPWKDYNNTRDRV